jgi:hypothetical protein
MARKLSTGDDPYDDDAFRNRTLRFTNNNFVGRTRDNSHNAGVDGWEDGNIGNGR